MASAVQPLAGLLEDSAVRAGLEWFRRERAWINEQHLALVRVPAPTFFEEQRAQWIAARFRSLGWEAKLDRAGNVIANLPGRRDKGGVAVTAHLDTVLAPRTADDIRVNGDGRLLGPGVSDNGAGLSALLALAAMWKECAPLADADLAPVIIANVGEEGEGNLSGMRYLCRNGQAKRYRAFLVLDGPGVEHITCHALGSRRFDVTITGPGGHSWHNHGAPNPVHTLARVIATFTERAQRAEDESDTRSSFNFGIVQGGTSINSIPQEARAKVDLRSENDRSMDFLAELLTASVEEAAMHANVRANGSGKLSAKVKEIGSRPGGDLAPNEPILEYLMAVDAHLGIRSQQDRASTDANIPLSLGLPAVSIGAGGQGGGAHTPAEWYSPEGRDLGLRRAFLALCMLLNAR
jgi:acetylornithine deacetylase/succinyl-diaminopimelate desuccinylase-like protein